MLNEKYYFYGSNRSTIRDLFEYGSQRKAVVGAENVYDYSLGNPSVPAPEEVKTAIIDILNERDPIDVHGYTSAVGDFGARKAIADDLNSRFGTSYEAGELYLTCGAAASLISVFRALCANEKSELIAVAPYFPEYKCFAESNGLTFKCVSADKEHFQINFSELENMITENTQAVIINSPNNPSGTVYSEDTVKKLGALLEKKSAEFSHPVYLISDEPYRELNFTSVPTPFTAKFYKNTIVCYSYIKSLSLPGERIGYVLVPKEADDSARLYAAVAGAARCSGFVCAPSLFQRVIEKCASVRPDIEAYRKNRDYLYKSLTDIGYKCASPDGAFYMFIEAPNGDDNAFSEICKKYDLLLVPADSFGCPGYVRASYCVSYDMIVRSIPAFKKAYEDSVKAK